MHTHDNLSHAPLGRPTLYPERYDPALLFGIERTTNRSAIGYASGETLPFVGVDLWNAWEVSMLLDCGLPCVGALRIVYSALSPRLVESKSFKLYLNSFNQEIMGATVAEAFIRLCETVKKDLTPILGVAPEVRAVWADTHECPLSLSQFQTLEELHPTYPIVHYSENRDLLRGCGKGGELRVHSALLRSRCSVTGQPDWGDIYMMIHADDLPSTESLLAYVVSFRQEQHFHEEIVEAVYYALDTVFKPSALMVSARYTRRGGLDINPTRYRLGTEVAGDFTDGGLFARTFRQ